MTNYKTFVICTAAIVCTTSCKEHVPPTSSEKYNQLHGIINDGKTANTITLINETRKNAVTLRFPPGMYVYVYTSGSHNPKPSQIKKGFATSARVTLHADKLNILPPSELKAATLLSQQVVSVNLYPPADLNRKKFNTKDVGTARLTTLNSEYQKPIPRPELGLLEYRPNISDRSKSIIFVPLDPDYRTLNGNLLFIGYWRQDQSYTLPSQCSTNYVQPDGLIASAIWQTVLLPYWKNVDRSVSELLNRISI